MGRSEYLKQLLAPGLFERLKELTRRGISEVRHRYVIYYLTCALQLGG